MEFKPSLISWNLTQRCNLVCGHCYLDASRDAAEGELSENECLRVVDEIAELCPGAMLVLSGGEPLLRPDFFSIARHAARRGLMVVVGSNGTMITGELARQMASCGVLGVGISLDSLDPALHDSLRGMPGAWKKAVAGIEAAKNAGLQAQIQMTVMRSNRHEMASMVEFADSIGARAFNVFFLVCTGRGQKASDLISTEYEQVLLDLVGLQGRYPGLIVRARCAPHFARLAPARDAGPGCMAATSYCRITPQGEVTPCPYLPVVAGDLRKQSFAQIWEASPDFSKLRQGQGKGKCGACDFASTCGGCRARAFATSADYMAEDPYCLYQPQGKPGEKSAPASVTWTAEARQRMEKAPVFVRSMAMRMVERYAQEHGYSEVTPELLDKIRQNVPAHRPM